MRTRCKFLQRPTFQTCPLDASARFGLVVHHPLVPLARLPLFRLTHRALFALPFLPWPALPCPRTRLRALGARLVRYKDNR